MTLSVFWCSFINRIPVIRNLFTSQIVDFKGTETSGKSPLNLLDFFRSCKEGSSVLFIREQSNNLSHNNPPPRHALYLHSPTTSWILVLEDGTDRLSRNVGKELSLFAV